MMVYLRGQFTYLTLHFFQCYVIFRNLEIGGITFIGFKTFVIFKYNIPQLKENQY